MLVERVQGLLANLRFSNGLQILWRRLFRRDSREEVYVWKDRVRIFCDCSRHDHVALQEIFCRGCYEPFLRKCHVTGDRIRYVNVGAHIGGFDLWLRDRGLELQSSLAVELNPDTWQRCERNFSVNGLTGVTLLNYGLAASDAVWDFAPSENSLGDGIFQKQEGVTTRVELVTLRTLFIRHAEDKGEFDLLKLDCEGAEYGVLRTASPKELRRFRAILIEFHPEPSGESVRAAYDQLRAAGFASQLGAPGVFRFVDLFVRI